MPLTHHQQYISKRQQGFTLLEVMVALLVFSIGLLGLASLQVSGLSFNRSAYERTQANYLAYDILDKMRANRTAANDGSYDNAFGDYPSALSCVGSTANCSAANMAQADIYQWKNELGTLLASGKGSVARSIVGGATVIVVTVRWDDHAGGTTDFIVRGEL